MACKGMQSRRVGDPESRASAESASRRSDGVLRDDVELLGQGVQLPTFLRLKPSAVHGLTLRRREDVRVADGDDNGRVPYQLLVRAPESRAEHTQLAAGPVQQAILNAITREAI